MDKEEEDKEEVVKEEGGKEPRRKEVQILFQVQLEPIGWKGFLLCTTWQQFPLKRRKVRANCFEQLKT